MSKDLRVCSAFPKCLLSKLGLPEKTSSITLLIRASPHATPALTKNPIKPTPVVDNVTEQATEALLRGIYCFSKFHQLFVMFFFVISIFVFNFFVVIHFLGIAERKLKVNM